MIIKKIESLITIKNIKWKNVNPQGRRTSNQKG